jgi:hypothetical protein
MKRTSMLFSMALILSTRGWKRWRVFSAGFPPRASAMESKRPRTATERDFGRALPKSTRAIWTCLRVCGLAEAVMAWTGRERPESVDALDGAAVPLKRRRAFDMMSAI